MIIDIHCHAYRVKVPFVTPFCTAEELIKEYDRMGIDMGVLLPVVNPEIYLTQSNEDVLEMAEKYPNRFIPFCNIDPRALTNSPYAPLDEVMEYYKQKGAKGIGEVMCNLEVLDPLVQNLFQCAEKAGLSVTYDGAVHVGGAFGLCDEPNLPQLEFSLQRFPQLTILGHGPCFWSEIAKLETPGERAVIFNLKGEQVVYLPTGKIKEEGAMPKLLRKYKNLSCDLSDGTAYNALTRDLDYTAAFLEEFQGRVYFGTDMCFPGMDVPLIGTLKDWLKSGMISKAVYDKITHENAMRLLKI